MRNHRKFGRRIFDNYGGSTHHMDIQDEYGYTNSNGYRNRDYDDRNYWHNDNDLYGDRNNYNSNYHSNHGNRRRIYTDKGFEEGGYNPNLNDGYYGEESRGYHGRNANDYDSHRYGRHRHYRPEDYDQGTRRNNYQSNRYNDYADIDYNRDKNHGYGGFTEERRYSNARPYYNEYESYPSYRRNDERAFKRRNSNSEYNEHSYRKKPYYNDNW